MSFVSRESLFSLLAAAVHRDCERIRGVAEDFLQLFEVGHFLHGLLQLLLQLGEDIFLLVRVRTVAGQSCALL